MKGEMMVAYLAPGKRIVFFPKNALAGGQFWQPEIRSRQQGASARENRGRGFGGSKLLVGNKG